MKIKVGVIFGGESVEHEVSIITAVQAMEFIDKEKYDVIPIYVSKDRTWYTGKMLMEMDVYKDFNSLKKYAQKCTLVKKENGFFLIKTKGIFQKEITELDLVFPMVHGKGAEDGSLAGYLDFVGIPYVGCDMLGASLGQDKVIQRQIMELNNIKIPKYTWFYDSEYLLDNKKIIKDIKSIGYPVIVKPAKLGSSIGISIAKNDQELESCIMDAINYDTKIIVEEVIPNLTEVNCSVFGNYEYQETSALAEMLTKNAFLTFNDKYIGSGKGKLKTGRKNSGKMSNSEMVIPARISKDIEDKIRDLSVQTFRALNLRGTVRIDFLINSKTNDVYVNEPNTIPGSLSFYMWKKDKDYTKLLDDMITMTIKDYKNMSKKTTSFDSNILSTYNGAKGVKGIKR